MILTLIWSDVVRIDRQLEFWRRRPASCNYAGFPGRFGNAARSIGMTLGLLCGEPPRSRNG